MVSVLFVARKGMQKRGEGGEGKKDSPDNAAEFWRPVESLFNSVRKPIHPM
jgi:hypothetical protein